MAMQLQQDPETSVYYEANADARGLDYYWTFWCGDGGEEIDVAARTEATARAIVREAIRRDYDPIEPYRVERRAKGVMYL